MTVRMGPGALIRGGLVSLVVGMLSSLFLQPETQMAKNAVQAVTDILYGVSVVLLLFGFLRKGRKMARGRP